MFLTVKPNSCWKTHNYTGTQCFSSHISEVCLVLLQTRFQISCIRLKTQTHKTSYAPSILCSFLRLKLKDSQILLQPQINFYHKNNHHLCLSANGSTMLRYVHLSLLTLFLCRMIRQVVYIPFSFFHDRARMFHVKH